MLYELCTSYRTEDLSSRNPFRPPKPEKATRQNAAPWCHTWGCAWALLGLLLVFLGTPGALSLCSQLLLDCSWSDCPGSRPPKPERTAQQGVAPWCHTWSCFWALLGSSGLARALWRLLAALGCSWLLLVAPRPLLERLPREQKNRPNECHVGDSFLVPLSHRKFSRNQGQVYPIKQDIAEFSG